jgi:hypothetical protein
VDRATSPARQRFPSRFDGEFRGDEGARPARRLDDDDRAAKTRDNPVAAGKVASPRFPTERHFADCRALFDDLFKEGFMFGRVNIPQTACKDRDRSTLDRRLMRPCVDPAREPGDRHLDNLIDAYDEGGIPNRLAVTFDHASRSILV